MDVNFTANMESLLDGVAEGKVDGRQLSRISIRIWMQQLKKQKKNWKVKIEDEVTDVICEECGRNMVSQIWPTWKIPCMSGFPDCRNTKPYLEKIGVACPKCGKDCIP